MGFSSFEVLQTRCTTIRGIVFYLSTYGSVDVMKGASLNFSIFSELLSLIGSDAAILLSRHEQEAERHLGVIRTALLDKQLGEIGNAAHALRSASQIGAIRVAELAEQLEDMAEAPEPDLIAITVVVHELELAQKMAMQAVWQVVRKNT